MTGWNGNSGKLGRSVVAYLADEGWEVINADTRRPAGTSEGVCGEIISVIMPLC